MVGGADAAGRGPSAKGGGDAPAADRPDIAAQCRVGGLALGRLLSCQLLRQFENLGLDRLGLGGEVVHVLLIFALTGPQLRHQGIGRLPLLVQLGLLADQLRLGGLRLGLLRLQGLFLLLDFRLEVLEVLDDLLVRVHDLVDKVQPAQQVRKAVRFEKHGPIADGAPLLHGPDPLAEQLVLGRFPFLGVQQLCLRLGDQLRVSADLALHIGYLTAEHADLAIQQFLFLHIVGDIIRQRADLALKLFLLLAQITGVVLQLVDVRLGHRQRRRQIHAQHADRQQQCRQHLEDPPRSFRMFHGTFLTPAGTSEWRTSCRPRR